MQVKWWHNAYAYTVKRKKKEEKRASTKAITKNVVFSTKKNRETKKRKEERKANNTADCVCVSFRTRYSNKKNEQRLKKVLKAKGGEKQVKQAALENEGEGEEKRLSACA